MTNIIIILGLILSFFGIVLYMQAKNIRLGRNKQKLEDAEDIIDNVKKNNSVKHDDTFDDKLRNKYRK